jgi:serine protease SohB
MMDFVLQYGLFAAKTLTLVAAAWVVIALAASFSRRGRQPDRLEVNRLNDHFADLKRALETGILPHKDFKAKEKARRRDRKALGKRSAEEAAAEKRVFVINFRGDIRASAVTALREEITALLTMARPEDEVLLRLENAGGLVHDHGLAASQLARIRERGIPLTIAVDKIAASGGYMMACVGTRIIAAPFAVLGSIGVLMQLPNFHRLLDTHGVDFELLKAGEYKRKLTLFGENTREDRARMQQEVDETHALFKDFVREHRPQLDIGTVATGEHWYGRRALDLALCDELRTSDDYLLDASRESELYELVYTGRKPVIRKLTDILGDISDTVLRRRVTMAI